MPESIKKCLTFEVCIYSFLNLAYGSVKIRGSQRSAALLIKIPLHNLHRAREDASQMFSLQIHHLFQSCQKDRRQMSILQAVALLVLTIKILG